MRSTSDRSASSHQEDLTAVARIRAAAMTRFAADGFGVGLRAIAADAGVTAGLITHHFGSKEGLRQACDAEVLRQMDQAKRDSEIFGGSAKVMTQMAQAEQYIPASAYALRSLMEGGELARTLMEMFATESESLMAAGVAAGTINPSMDEVARARYHAYAEAGALLMYMHYEAPDPTDIQAVVRDYYTTYGPVALESYCQPVFTDPSMLTPYLDAAQASRPGAASAAHSDSRPRSGDTPEPSTSTTSHQEEP